MNQLRVSGENFSNCKIIEKFFISVTEKYDFIMTIIAESKDIYIYRLSLTKLMSSLEAYEKWINHKNEGSLESVFQSKFKVHSQKLKPKWKKTTENSSRGESSKNTTNKKYPACGICKRTSPLEKDCWFHGKPKCLNCHKFGYERKMSLQSKPSNKLL